MAEKRRVTRSVSVVVQERDKSDNGTIVQQMGGNKTEMVVEKRKEKNARTEGCPRGLMARACQCDSRMLPDDKTMMHVIP